MNHCFTNYLNGYKQMGLLRKTVSCTIKKVKHPFISYYRELGCLTFLFLAFF
ncbi:MAG: hypothetical protein E7150_06945 [Bacillus sp. (in: Bacteria)]|nr:hypothetical protein [Bacillus sp. (in: firmicutes)]